MESNGTARRKAGAGWVDHRALAKGPNGRALCRQCGIEVPAGRRTFCSHVCVHKWKLASDPGYCRFLVFQRDGGVCAVCGVDTEDLRVRLSGLFQQYNTGRWWRYSYHPEIAAFLRWLGITPSRWPGSLWDADHIIPVVEGGGGCDLDNYRTLCIPCHQQITRDLLARLARRRRGGEEAANNYR